jgi:integrase
MAVPATIAAAGDHAARRFLEFFAATIRNMPSRASAPSSPCGSKIISPMASWWVRLHEKGGKRQEMPAPEAYLDEYMRTAGISGEPKSPLFRSAIGRTGTLAATAIHRVDAWRMIQRCSGELGLKVKIGCHTFRATGITAYLESPRHHQALRPHR